MCIVAWSCGERPSAESRFSEPSPRSLKHLGTASHRGGIPSSAVQYIMV